LPTIVVTPEDDAEDEAEGEAGPNAALQALLDAEQDTRSFWEDPRSFWEKAGDFVGNFVSNAWDSLKRMGAAMVESPGDAVIGLLKGVGNLPTDLINLAGMAAHASPIGQLANLVADSNNRAALEAYKTGDLTKANELATTAAKIKDFGHVGDLFKLENDAQKGGAIVSIFVPVGAVVKAVGGAAKVAKGAKVVKGIDTTADFVKGADTFMDTVKGTDAVGDAFKGADTFVDTVKGADVGGDAVKSADTIADTVKGADAGGDAAKGADTGADAAKTAEGAAAREGIHVVPKAEANFADANKLSDHFKKHGAEFGAGTPDEYLQIGRDIMRNGEKVEYLYKGEIRTGYVQFMGNSSKGSAKFGFVGTNADRAITTIHTESGKSFWKMLNGNPLDKTIRGIK
jgi:hypothetical protein